MDQVVQPGTDTVVSPPSPGIVSSGGGKSLALSGRFAVGQHRISVTGAAAGSVKFTVLSPVSDFTARVGRSGQVIDNGDEVSDVSMRSSGGLCWQRKGSEAAAVWGCQKTYSGSTISE